MKSYVRDSLKPRNAYFTEIETAMDEAFGAGVALVLYSLALNNNFGEKRLNGVLETCKDLCSNSKGRRTDLKEVIMLLKDKYNIDVTSLDPMFIVKTHK